MYINAEVFQVLVRISLLFNYFRNPIVQFAIDKKSA